MAIEIKECPNCNAVDYSMFDYCDRCGNRGYVEYDTTDKYYYCLMAVAVLYFAAQLLRHFF